MAHARFTDDQEANLDSFEHALVNEGHPLDRAHLASYGAGFVAALASSRHSKNTQTQSNSQPFDTSSPQFLHSSSSPAKPARPELDDLHSSHLDFVLECVTRGSDNIKRADKPTLDSNWQNAETWLSLAGRLNSEVDESVESLKDQLSHLRARSAELERENRKLRHRVGKSEHEAEAAKNILSRLSLAIVSAEGEAMRDLDSLEARAAPSSACEADAFTDEEEDSLPLSSSESEDDAETEERWQQMEAEYWAQQAEEDEQELADDDSLAPTEIEDNDEGDSNKIPFYYDDDEDVKPPQATVLQAASLHATTDVALRPDQIQPRRLFTRLLPPNAHDAERNSPISRLPLRPRVNPPGLVDPFKASNPFAVAGGSAARELSSSLSPEEGSAPSWLRKRKADALEAAESAAEDYSESESEAGEDNVKGPRRVVQEMEVDEQVTKKGKGREIVEKSKTRPPTRATKRKSLIRTIRQSSRSQSEEE